MQKTALKFFNSYLETTCKQSKLTGILGKIACNVLRICSVIFLDFTFKK